MDSPQIEDEEPNSLASREDSDDELQSLDEAQQQLIAERQEFSTDEPRARTKKYRSKKANKLEVRSPSTESEVLSESASIPSTTEGREEYYDAHDSDLALIGPKVTDATLLTAESPEPDPEQNQSPAQNEISCFSFAMEKIPARYKAKNKKSASNAKPKTTKKRKNDGPTCSMFLAELTRKFASKKKLEEEMPKNIVQTIVDSITNALPVKLSRKSPPKIPSPMKMETLQIYAPELLPNDTLRVPPLTTTNNEEEEIEDVIMAEAEAVSPKSGSFKMPKMPVINSEVFKMAALERKKAEPMQDEAVNTGPDHDVASELTKHVNTLRKISLIAEEFNQKTAKNLKEIVDSVQDDLIKKLEEINTNHKTISDKTVTIQEELESIDN